MGKHFRAAWLSLGASIALAVGFSIGCGGSSGVNGPAGQDNAWPVHGFEDAARSGAFAAVAVDGSERTVTPLTRELTLDVRPDGNGSLVRLIGTRVEAQREIFLHLQYDSTTLHPTLTRSGQWMPEDAVFLGITSQPGLVVLGLAATGRSLVSGEQVELAAVRFEPGGWQSSRGTSAVSGTPVDDLHFSTTTTGQLLWSYACQGDYDQNSEVGISDITPIGIHLKKTPGSADWAAARLADGDSNGEVNASDLVPIGTNYREMITGYQVKGGGSQTGPFVNDLLIPFNVNFPIPPGGGRRQFSHTLGTPVDGSWYVVTAVSGEGEAAVSSNAVQFNDGGGGVFDPPQNLSAAEAGLAVQLTWDAPAGSTPDSYNCYYSLGAGMTGAQMMNLPGQVTTLTFDCPLAIQPTGTYYFGVKAVYGSTESAYSNIFGYNTGGTVEAPSNLQAAQVGNIVQLSWAASPGGTDTYNCYVGTDATMTGAILMNLPPTPLLQYDCPLAIDAATEHYFGVKAFDGTAESAYSNIFHYTPGGGGGDDDVTPPVWQQGEGIKSATPSQTGGSITVSWYIATDADTPPVQYLLYVVPDGTPIDWDDPADVFDAAITSVPVTALADGTPLQDGQRYEFAVKARDAVAPTPNRTSNVNSLFATPQFLPNSPTHIPDNLNPVSTSDNASVRVAGEEVPRMAGVNHGNPLYYIKWDLSLQPPAWTVVDLNTANANCPTGRKYHPQLVAVGDTVHLLFATSTAVYEAFGPKDDPANWAFKTIATGLSATPGITGTALVHSAAGDYLACVYSGRSGTDQVFYSDRDMDGEWVAPVSIMNGNPQIWQCDMTIDETTGKQWVVAANGQADGGGDLLKFWYVTRDDRSSGWGTATNSGYGGDVMTIDMDYTANQPVVVCAEVRDVDTGFGAQPVSDATIFSWTGNAWAKQVLESGDCVIDLGSFTIDTILTGQDPQLVFSPSSKAIALWTNLDFFVDIVNDESTLTGDWRFAQRPLTTWSSPASLLPNISSSNSVSAGESFQHCITSDLGQVDSGTADEIANKYSVRNDYVAGDLYYVRRAWN